MQLPYVIEDKMRDQRWQVKCTTELAPEPQSSDCELNAYPLYHPASPHGRPLPTNTVDSNFHSTDPFGLMSQILINSSHLFSISLCPESIYEKSTRQDLGLQQTEEPLQRSPVLLSRLLLHYMTKDIFQRLLKLKTLTQGNYPELYRWAQTNHVKIIKNKNFSSCAGEGQGG